MKNSKINKRIRRKFKIRKKIVGTDLRPRLSIYKSNSFIYAQLINDDASVTIASASGINSKEKGIKMAEFVGDTLAKAAVKKGYKSVVFDRGGYVYHGKVKALADAARKAGLEF